MITVLTPFSRKENKELLTRVLFGKCNWIVLQAEDEPDYDFPEWVTVKRYKASQPNLSNQLLNAFFKEADDETQYIVLCDDDSVEEGFFSKIPNEDVVCVSMQRNDYPAKHIVWDDWATKSGHYEYGMDILYAHPDNMKVASVGGEQLICKGKVLKQFEYGMDDSTAVIPGDFKFINDVMSKYPVTFVPHAFVLFNYFEDGRFQGFKRLPVVLFVGDYYCAGNLNMGISEWEGNLWASLDATRLANVARFHMDKYYYHTGIKGDRALLERIEEIRPDFIVLVIYKQFGTDMTVIDRETIEAIKVPIISIWGDLEADEVLAMCKDVEPYMYKVIGTASKEIVEANGYKYMHVPKDPTIFNNPNKERDLDVVFSGSFGYGRDERREVLQYLIDNGIKLTAGGSEGKDHFTTEEYADRYKRAKIAISFSQARGKNVVNARPFEVMHCGAMLLEQKSPELAKLYTEGEDYGVWITKEDLLEKIRYYLEHEEERCDIADSGHKKTQELYSAHDFWVEVLK